MCAKLKGKNDEAWEALFQKYHILEEIDRHGKLEISADKIREFREPRLMAKFDHRVNLPAIFADHQICILPISRGDYVLSRFEAYHDFEPSQTPIRPARLPLWLQSLSPESIPSEAIAINCALASGILGDFLGEERLVPTVSGRMGSDDFDFSIRTVDGGFSRLEVRGSQIEIDAGFEGERCLTLLEAKRDLSEDFLVRQLYYPFRAKFEKLSKALRPVFLVYSNGVYTLYEYEFENPALYNSLRLVQCRRYALEETAITAGDLAQVLKSVHIVTEPPVPFPQADKFERVVNLCELLAAHPLSREEVTGRYAFDVRQTNYYTDAGRYLGLIERDNTARRPVYRLTEQGRRIMGLRYQQRQLELSRCILSHRVFYTLFETYLSSGYMPDRREVVARMEQSSLYHVDAPSTYRRRASTVGGWLAWIADLIQPTL